MLALKVKGEDEIYLLLVDFYTFSKKPSLTFLAATRESIVGFL